MRRSILTGFLLVVFCGLYSGDVSGDTLKRVLVFETMPVPVILEGSEVFRQAIAEFGFQHGFEVEFQVLKAEGDKELGHKVLAEALAKQRPDLVVSIATMASIITHEQLRQTDIPWLFFTVTDPVGAGLIEQENQPTGKNVSGRIYGIDRTTKLDMVKKLIVDVYSQRPLKIGMIHTDYPSSLGDVRMLHEAVDRDPDFVLVANQMGYEPVPDRLNTMLQKVEKAITEMEESIDIWWSPTGPLGERDEYTELLVKKSAKPVVMATNLRGVRAGALLYLGPDVPAQAREVASLADRILRGEDIAKMPVTMPKVFNVGLNLKTAEQLGLVVPSDILSLAVGNLYH